MRIGGIRTSVKLESEYWAYLDELAQRRRVRLPTLVNEVATSVADPISLASTLRTFSLAHARRHGAERQRELDRSPPIGRNEELAQVLDAYLLPCLILDADRVIRQLNRTFALWLNLDARATLGQRLDNVMILRGPNTSEMWTRLHDGRLARAAFSAAYVAPGKVRVSQATAVALGSGEMHRRGSIVMFETAAAQTNT